MTYFAGPITLSPSDSAALMGALATAVLVVVGLVYLFASNMYRAVKRTNSSRRKIFTITLPVVTLLFFVIWIIASMATKQARYTDTFSISTVLANTTLGLFSFSVLTALYYAFKK